MTPEQIIQAINETVPSEKYQKEVKVLSKKKADIYDHWMSGSGLFAFLETDVPSIEDCGCLTMVKSGSTDALDKNGNVDNDLTEAIREMPFPETVDDISPADLPLFAKAQTFYDNYVGRK